MILLATLSLGMMTAPTWAAGGVTRPNVILIIADDMAWDDCGAYGHPTIRTPHIDKLARGGMRFDRAFLTCSSCSPSRSSIITGRYPHNTGAEELHWPLPAEQVTFVETLKAAGYWTAAAGKWHLGEAVKDRFDVVREADPSSFQLPAGRGAAAARLGAGVRGDAASGCGQWVPTLRDRPKDRPFFLWLAALDPHRDYQAGAIPEPHRPDAAVVPPYLPDTPEVRADLALYYDEIGRLDRFVGAVVAEVDRQGIAEQTLILFLSDNGRPFPRCKTTLYDSGIRTPWIVRWPGHVAPGSRCTRLVSSIDIAPTILKLAGIEAGPIMQGRDFSPLLKDPAAKVRDLVFAERNWHDYAARGRAVRSERFKYIRNSDSALPLTPPADAVRSPTFRALRRLRDAGTLAPEQRACFVRPRPAEELYDLETDPHELHDLAGDPNAAEVLDRMRRALAGWERETGDEAPAALSPDEFDRETGEPLPNRARPRPTKKPRPPQPEAREGKKSSPT
jgi:arylsulfatase A-like enzyme